MSRYDQNLRDPTELIVEPMGTTLRLHEEDLLEVREPEPPLEMLGPPDGVPWAPPDVERPIPRDRADVVEELPVELNTTLSLHDEDLFEVREWIEPPGEHTIQIDPDGLDAREWVWELKPPLNPGMRLIRIVLMAALPVAALGAVLSLTVPFHLSRLSAMLASGTAEPRVKTFGELQLIDDLERAATANRTAAEAPSPVPAPEVTPSLQVWAKVVEAAVPDVQERVTTTRKPGVATKPRPPLAISRRKLSQHRWYRSSAKQAARLGRWRRARARAVAALKIIPDDPAARAIKRGAERKLSRHHRYLAGAKRAVQHKQWKRARRGAVAALRIVPQDRQARAIKLRAERKLRRHRQHLATARKAAQHRRWKRARSQAAAALRIAPKDRRARAIKRLAERKLQRQRRYL